MFAYCSSHPVRCVFSTLGDVQYIVGGSVHQGDTMSTSGDIMSTSGNVQYIGVFNKMQKSFMNLLPT